MCVKLRAFFTEVNARRNSRSLTLTQPVMRIFGCLAPSGTSKYAPPFFRCRRDSVQKARAPFKKGSIRNLSSQSSAMNMVCLSASRFRRHRRASEWKVDILHPANGSVIILPLSGLSQIGHRRIGERRQYDFGWLYVLLDQVTGPEE